MLGNFSLFTHPCYISSLFLKREWSSWSDYKQAQGDGTKLKQHCYNDTDIVAGFCFHWFSSLSFVDSNYIHKFWVYVYHFNRFSFIGLSFICNACGVMSFFPCHFLFAVAWIDNLVISLDINNYSIFIFTMVTIPFGLIHYSLVLIFYTPWKHQKTFRFSDVLKGYRKASPGCNGLTRELMVFATTTTTKNRSIS